VVQEQIQEALVDLAAEEAQGEGGGLKVLKDVTSELEGMVPKGEGQMNLISSAGTLDVWNRHSGRHSHILTDQLRFQLRKRFPRNHPMAGQRVYSLKPVDVAVAPKLKCWLHPDHPKREWLNKIGLVGKTCLAASIPTEYAIRVHMRRRHPTAYDLILDEERKEEKRKDNELRQKELEALQKIAGPKRETYECPHCDRFFDTPQGLKLHITKEHKDAIN